MGKMSYNQGDTPLNNRNLARLFTALALTSVGCAAFGPVPPSQAHLEKANGNPALALGNPGAAKIATCRTRDAKMTGDTLGSKIDLDLICRSPGGEPGWNVKVHATCTAVAETGGACLETGTWTLRWIGRAEIDKDPQDLGTTEHSAAAFQGFLRSLEPKPNPEASNTPPAGNAPTPK